MPRFFRFVLLLLVLGVAGAVAARMIIRRSPNTEYKVYELVYHERFHRYDQLIREACKRRGLDPMVVKAIVWRESKFRPEKTGLDGERGLMQITDAAAKEWVKNEKPVGFVPTDLFDPKVNLDAGTWLIARALRRYEGADDPLPFALAEYNAGRSRVAKWTGDREGGDNSHGSSQEFAAKIDIPSTRKYIETVQGRVKYYRERGQL